VRLQHARQMCSAAGPTDVLRSSRGSSSSNNRCALHSSKWPHYTCSERVAGVWNLLATAVRV
jgi:hypothetical protein